MLLGLSTICAGAAGHDPDRLMDLFQRAGAAGIELDATLAPAFLEELILRLKPRRDEFPVWMVENVCPDRREQTAELASHDREEARTAVRAATETLRLAADLEAHQVTLRLGEVGRLKSAWPRLRRGFLRDELDDQTLADQLRQRAVLGAPYLDAARRSLEQLGRLADDLGLQLGIRNPARFIGLPSAFELLSLLDDLAGAPIVPLWDLPATHLLTLFGVPAEEIRTVWQRAPFVYLANACGPIAGLGVDQGELNLAALIRDLNPATRAIFRPWPGLNADEVLSAMASLENLPLPSHALQDVAPAPPGGGLNL
jgi:sugar phosphate isomerase/epimerase